MRRRSEAGWAGVATLVCLLAAPRAAEALRYKPKPDETIEHIARIHYGSAAKKIYLVATNGIAEGEPLHRRKSLWVPTVWRYRIKRGDDLAKLARKYLKAPERAEFLIWLNQIKDPKDIEVNTLISMPFLIRHRVQEGQDIVDLARRYYFNAKQAGVLRKFNDRRTNSLKAGEIVLVPIFDPEAATDKVRKRVEEHEQQLAEAARAAREQARRLAEAKAKERAERDRPAPVADQPAPGADAPPAADSAAPGPDSRDPLAGPETPADDPAAVLDGPGSNAAERPSPPDDLRLIRESFELYRDGEYELARGGLIRALDTGRLARADEAEAREVLAHCLVALEKHKEAEHEFVRLLMIAPERSLDPVTTSPKVLEVFRRARGKR